MAAEDIYRGNAQDYKALTNSRVRSKAAKMAVSSDRSGVKFLFTELKAGLTFARIASSTKTTSIGKRTRNISTARKAYDCILHFQERVPLSETEAMKLNAGMSQLKKALQALEETH